MVNEQKGRVNDALTSLVKLYLPTDGDENEEVKRLFEGNVYRLGTLSTFRLMDLAGTIKWQFPKISITRPTGLGKHVREHSSVLHRQTLTPTPQFIKGTSRSRKLYNSPT